MKITVTGKDNFIKKNLVENLKTISDGRNRSRTDLSISAVAEDGEGDVMIRVPDTVSEDNELVMERKGCRTVISAPGIVGKWDKSDRLVPSLCRAAANDGEWPDCDRSSVLKITFIDDLINEILDLLEGKNEGKNVISPKSYNVTPDTLTEELTAFNKLNSSLVIREMPPDSFSYKFYSLYLSFLPERKITYPVHMNADSRGVFTELFKTVNNGQVSVNISKPGITKGQHWHNTKWEIFVVVSGHGLIREREIGTGKVLSFDVRGEDMKAVIMLPGYTHSITNLDPDRELVTVMFANEQFNPEKPDTFFEEVEKSPLL